MWGWVDIFLVVPSGCSANNVHSIMIRHHVTGLLPVVGIAVLGGAQAVAGGFRIGSHDAAASARGEAFAATADNPSAIYYNPAGITQLEGHQVRVGAYGLKVDAEFNDSVSNGKDQFLVPQLYYTYNPEKLPVAFGLGFYSPYGLSSEWPEDSGFRSVAIEGDLKYWTLNPVVAWEIAPGLSLAAGPTLNYSRVDIRQGVLPYAMAGGMDYVRFQGDGTMVGFSAGLLWQPHEQISFGLSYRSETIGNYGGSMETTFHPALGVIPPAEFDSEADLVFPQNVVFGISFRPTEDWNFEVNVDWTDWDRVDTLEVTGLPPTTLDWESSFFYEAGVTRRLSSEWSVSAGYIYNQSCMPDENYTPLVADLNRHFGSVGVNYDGEHFGVSLAYQFGYGPEREVRGSAMTAVGESADGEYSFMSHGILLSAGYKF